MLGEVTIGTERAHTELDSRRLSVQFSWLEQRDEHVRSDIVGCCAAGPLLDSTAPWQAPDSKEHILDRTAGFIHRCRIERPNGHLVFFRGKMRINVKNAVRFVFEVAAAVRYDVILVCVGLDGNPVAGLLE